MQKLSKIIVGNALIWLGLSSCLPSYGQTPVLRWGYDNGNTSSNPNETQLTTANVNSTSFGKLGKYSVNGKALSQPLYVPGVNVSGLGVKNVVYITTGNGFLYAFDADAPGSTAIWSVNYQLNGTTPPDPDGGIGPQGIFGTPVIDLTTNQIYFIVKTLENGNAVMRLHAVDISSGKETAVSAVISGTSNGLVFSTVRTGNRPGLGISGSQVVVGIGGDTTSDARPYSGWAVTFDKTTLAQTGIMATNAKGQGASPWASGAGPSIDAQGRIYYALGQGPWSSTATVAQGAWDGVTNFNESVSQFTYGAGGLSMTDFYTPSNVNYLDGLDLDVGCSATALLPGTSYILTGGKTADTYVIDTNKMGHKTTNDTQLVQLLHVGTQTSFGFSDSDRILQFAMWPNSPNGNTLVYIWPGSDFLHPYQWNGSQLVAYGTIGTQIGGGNSGMQMALSANGSTSGTGILWANDSSRGILRAYNAENITSELWNSQQNSSRDSVPSPAKWVLPLVANGKVYLATSNNEVDVYGLLKTQQTITFPAIAKQNVGSTYTLNASASSGLAISYSSSPAAVCTITGTTVNFLTAGSCKVTATQAGNTTYAAAVPVSVTITVISSGTTPQTITFPALASQSVGGTAVLSATASSGLAITYTSGTPAVCSVTGASASFIGVGTCTITASQPGNATYVAATPVSQNITVAGAKLAQTINFPVIARQTVGASVTMTATASSSLAVTYTSTTPTTCTVSGATVTTLVTGTCTVTASQAGSTTYAAAAPVSRSFTISGKSQTITFPGIATQQAGKQLTLNATATSGLAVGYSTSTPTICSLSSKVDYASQVQPIFTQHCGACHLDAARANTPGGLQLISYATVMAGSTSVGAVVIPGDSANSLLIQHITGQALQMPPAPLAPLSATDIQTITNWIDQGAKASGVTTASFLTTGTCTITAAQAGSSTFSAATPVTNSFAVTKQSQTITAPSVPAQKVGSTLTLNATASSGLTVSYTTRTPTKCLVSGNSVSFIAGGACSIAASQGGNSIYAVAPTVTIPITVTGNTGKAQLITFPAIPAQFVTATYTLKATASSGLAVNYNSTTPSVCSVSGNVVTSLSAGTCLLVASQPGDSTWATAPLVSSTFAVTLHSQTITFPAIPATAHGTSVTLSATATSGLPVTFASTTPAVCTVSGSNANLLAAGSCIISATQAGNNAFSAAPTIRQTITVR